MYVYACMYVCGYVQICMCTRSCVHIYVNAQVHVYGYVCVYVRMGIHTWACIDGQVCTYLEA